MSLQRAICLPKRFQLEPFKVVFTTNTRNRSTTNLKKSQISPSQWDLFAGICLQRCPLIVPELNWLEKRVQNVFNRVELFNSLYSDHEMRHFEDLRRAERIATGVNVGEKDLEEAAKQTAQDFEETSIQELKEFKMASSITKADESNNEKSIDRSLDRYLYLVVKTKIGQKDHWLFPQELHQNGESLRETAERALNKCFPANNKDSTPIFVKFMGNCPSVLYSYRYPKEVSQQKQKYGARIFFFKCQLDVNHDKQPAAQGQFGDRILKPDSTHYTDFVWLTRSELGKRMPERYWNKVNTTIYPDELINLDHQLRQKKQDKIRQMSNKLEKIEASN